MLPWWEQRLLLEGLARDGKFDPDTEDDDGDIPLADLASAGIKVERE